MKLTKLFYLLTFLLLAWSGAEVLGQCPNSYSIQVQKHPSCNSAFDGSLSVRGTTNYWYNSTYQWNNGATGFDIQGVRPGNYSVTVTDPTNCVYVVNQYVGPSPIGPNVRIDFNSCGRSLEINGDVDVNTTYAWSTGETTKSTGSLVPGFYTVTVTNANGCVATRQYSIPANATAPLSATYTATPATCQNADGTVDLTPTGGVPPYAYSWYQAGGSTIPAVEDPTNLKVGDARVRITDANGCTTFIPVFIPGAYFTGTVTNASCGLNNGSINLNVQGFTNPTYSWSNGAATQNVSNLGHGFYTVTVSDNNCSYFRSFNVRQKGNISVYLMDDTTNCNDVVIRVYSSDGATPHQYLWNTGQTTSVIPAINGVGTYSVTVTDANGCTATRSISNVSANAGITTSGVVTHATCGNSDGAIDLTITGNYQQVLWEPTGATTEDLNNIAAGWHKVKISNYLGCTVWDSFAVGEFITYQANPASCGGNNGSASVTAYNMTNPTYSWSNGATTAGINNVAAGTYTVTVVNNTCTLIESIVIPDAGILSASIEPSEPCAPAHLTANPINGLYPYTYSWNTGSTSQFISSPTVGTAYNLTITDANGCTATASYTVPNYPSMQGTKTTVDAVCGNKNGQASVQITGGATPYSYNWSTGTGNVPTQNALYPGQYSVVVTDNNGCTLSVPNIVVGGQINMGVTGVVTNATSSSYSGAIDITVTNATNPTFIWSTGATTEDISGLSRGFYTVSVTNPATGCVVERLYRVTSPSSGGGGGGGSGGGGGISVPHSIISGFVGDVSATNTCAGGYALRNRMVRLQPTGQVAFTDRYGRYSFTVYNPGNYTVEYINNDPNATVLCPIGNSIAVSNLTIGNNSFGNNFYVAYPPRLDLTISLLDYSNATPGFPYVTRIRYCNKGNTFRSGTIEYDYENFLGFQDIRSNGTQLTFHDIANDRFNWAFNNLSPNQCRTLSVIFTVPVGTALGTNITGVARVLPIANDVNPTDNTDSEQTEVVGSYDPNDKQVDLYRTGNAWDGGSIYTTDNTLEYTIRFQNTGTAPAQFVVVRDTLDVNLLPETVREIDSKHDMEVSLEDGNILVFTFNNINLPDSSVSQEQSIGFIHFKIDRVAGLPVGTQISNQAAIYFDYNAPIFTNTPISVIDQFTAVVDLKKETFEIEALPNPFEQNLLVKYELKRASEVQVKLYNQLGQCVYQQAYAQQGPGAQQLFLTLQDLTSGLYILQVETEEGRSSKKLIKK